MSPFCTGKIIQSKQTKRRFIITDVLFDQSTNEWTYILMELHTGDRVVRTYNDGYETIDDYFTILETL